MEYAIEENVAKETLGMIEEEFGAVSNSNNRSVIIDAIQRGLIDFDQQSAMLTYRLQIPVEIDGYRDGKRERLEKISLHEPCYSEIDRFNAHITIEADAKGNFKADASMANRQTKKIIMVLSGISEGTFDKIKRRDFAVLQALSDFFS